MISRSEALQFAGIAPYYELEFLPDEYRDDEEIVLTAIEKHGYALEWASPRLRNMRHIILNAMHKLDGSAILFAGDDLKNNQEFALEVLRATKYQPERVISHVSSDIRDDKQFALKTVEICGLSLQFLNKLCSDFEVVLAAVSQCGLALKYASSSLRGNKSIVLAAVKNNGLSLMFALYKMRNNKEVVAAAILENPSSINFASSRIRKNKT